MDAKSYQLVELIYHRVSDESPDDVKQFIKHEAKGNQKIIDKVLNLLAIEDYHTFNQTSDNMVSKLTDIIQDQTNDFKSERYKLVEKIGEGGMGSVYLATRIEDDIEHKVAIKLINTAFTTKENIERFKKERQILANLEHENIARFIDAGATKSGILFVVMEYVPGITLKQYCLDNQLTVKQKLVLFLQLCDAIDYAHKNFIIHRDIKPANVMINNEGKLKLLDFGIAKLVDEDAQKMVATITKIMTPAYASPEQLLVKSITIQSDIYALGIVLFEMLIGIRPYQKYEGDSHSYQVKVIIGITTKPSQFIDNENSQSNYSHAISGDIDAVLTKTINPDIKLRYSTVSSLRSDIYNYLNGYPVEARTPNKWYFFKLFLLRNKFIATLSSLSLLAILSFSIFSFIQNEKLKNKTIELAEQRDEAVLQAKKAKLASCNPPIFNSL